MIKCKDERHFEPKIKIYVVKEIFKSKAQAQPRDFQGCFPMVLEVFSGFAKDSLQIRKDGKSPCLKGKDTIVLEIGFQ